MDRVPPRRHLRPPLAHGVTHRLSGGRRADPLAPRLPPHRRPQPDPRQRPRAGRHAPDRPQEPRHLRPLQHHPRAGTARRRGPARRLSGAAGAGGTSPPAAPRGRPRRPAPRAGLPPRTTRHRIRAHGPPALARGSGWTPPACAPRLAPRRYFQPSIYSVGPGPGGPLIRVQRDRGWGRKEFLRGGLEHVEAR